MSDYQTFLDRKSQLGTKDGFEPVWMPDYLFDFQKSLVEWALIKGKAAVLADCGLGKAVMALAWSENIVRKTNGRVLFLTPLAVGAQTKLEGEKFGIECERSRDGHLNGAKIIITNYEKLHLFNPSDFVAVAADEASILKSFAGETRKAVTRFMLKIPFRSLWTATAAPNDYVELGNHSEALGELGYTDMLTRFFTNSENASHHRMQKMNDQGYYAGEFKTGPKQAGGNHFAKLSFRVSQTINQWVLKGHAHEPFWRWVCSWARACRKPSDLGFDDGAFILPPLIENEHIVEPKKPADGMLFTLPAWGLNAEREERRRTLKERSERVAQLVNHNRPAVIWVHLNPEGDELERIIPGAVQVKGADSDEKKEESYQAFQSGQIRVMITKPKIGAWGLNWYHCNHVVTYASHSWEQFYQATRRCWRFGQKKPVTVDIIATTGEQYVRENMTRKAKAAAELFDELVKHMNASISIKRENNNLKKVDLPVWL